MFFIFPFYLIGQLSAKIIKIESYYNRCIGADISGAFCTKSTKKFKKEIEIRGAGSLICYTVLFFLLEDKGCCQPRVLFVARLTVLALFAYSRLHYTLGPCRPFRKYSQTYFSREFLGIFLEIKRSTKSIFTHYFIEFK